MRFAPLLTVFAAVLLIGCGCTNTQSPALVAVGNDSVHLWEHQSSAEESSYACTQAIELKGAYAVAASRRGIYVCTDHSVVKLDRRLAIVARRDFDSSWVAAVACNDSVVCAFVDRTLRLLSPDLKPLGEVEVVPRWGSDSSAHPFLAPDIVVRGEMCFVTLKGWGPQVDIRDPVKPRIVRYGFDEGDHHEPIDAGHHPAIAHWVEPHNKWWAVVHYVTGGWGIGTWQTVEFHDTLPPEERKYRRYGGLREGWKLKPDGRGVVQTVRYLMHGSGPPEEVLVAGGRLHEASVGSRWILATTAIDPPWAIVMQLPQKDTEIAPMLVRLRLYGDSLLMQNEMILPGRLPAFTFRYLIQWAFGNRPLGEHPVRALLPHCRLRQKGYYLAALIPDFGERLMRVTFLDVRRGPIVTGSIAGPLTANEQRGVITPMFDIAFVPE